MRPSMRRVSEALLSLEDLKRSAPCRLAAFQDFHGQFPTAHFLEPYGRGRGICQPSDRDPRRKQGGSASYQHRDRPQAPLSGRRRVHALELPHRPQFAPGPPVAGELGVGAPIFVDPDELRAEAAQGERAVEQRQPEAPPPV